MRQPIFKKIFFAIIVGVCAINSAQAALITSHFSDHGSNQWTVDLTLTNDNHVAGINEFTVYFSELLFSNLSIISSPQSWDSFVAQPDLFLGSQGFFDTYNPLALALGESQTGFTISFTFLGQGTPDALSFDALDDNFNLISSGSTTNAATRVPEPSVFLLMLMGFSMLMLGRCARFTSDK